MWYHVNKIQRTYTTFLTTVGCTYCIEFKNFVFLGHAFEVFDDCCFFLAITSVACISLSLRDDLKGDSHTLTGENSGKEHGNHRKESFPENIIHECSQEESKANPQATERSTTSESCDFDHKDIPTSKILSLSLSSSSLLSSSSETQEKPDNNTEKPQVSLKVQRNECSKDMIVHSVQKVLQEWCTQSTLQFLGCSVQTEARSSFPVQGMGFFLKSTPSCSNQRLKMPSSCF